jgi:hypothetical protein
MPLGVQLDLRGPLQGEGRRRGIRDQGSSLGGRNPYSAMEGMNSKSNFCCLDWVGTEKKSRLNPK